MLDINTRLQPHPKVVDTQINDEVVALLHLQCKDYYSLNTTGVRIWQSIKERLSIAEISQRLQTEFAVDAERAERNVLELADELLRQELVSIPAANPQ